MDTIVIPARDLLMLFTAAGVLAGVVDDVVRATPNMPADGALVDGGLVAVDAAGMTTGISAALGEAMQTTSELLAPLLESLTEVNVECSVE